MEMFTGNTQAPRRLLELQGARWLLGKESWGKLGNVVLEAVMITLDQYLPGTSLGSPVTPLPLLSFSITIPVQTFSNLQIRGQ